MNGTNRARVGIIGAGASGLVSAWLLEHNYDVTLFEKEDRLGGHAYTIPVSINNQTIPIEAGAEFFSDSMFGQLNRLLHILNVPTRSYPLTYTFYNLKNDRSLLMPPIHDGAIWWRSFTPRDIFTLIQLHHFVHSGKKIVDMHDTTITMKDYAD